MDRYSHFVIKHRKSIVVLFIIVTIISAVMFLGVGVNYNMVDYLPETAQSTNAIEIMNEEFTQTVPNSSVMVKDLSIAKALETKKKIAAVEGIKEVIWLDDMIDIKKPLEIADRETVESFYKNGNALFSITIQKEYEGSVVEYLRDMLGDEGAINGEAADLASMQSAAVREVLNATIILLPIILLILFLSTTSWIEPLFFLAGIGVSIVINMGTNLFFGQVSFVSFSVAPILQLAVSLDYAIFLLHSFGDYRKEHADPEVAMQLAIKKSVKAVAASALTTLFGFIALMFMDFGIGADLGLVLAKGIILSFASCVIFLPAFTLCCFKSIDKTRHRDFLPSFKNVNRYLSKIGIPLIIIVFLIAVPAFLGQTHVGFNYGNGDISSTGRSSDDIIAIESEFGRTNVLAILVPRGDIVKETKLSKDLNELDHVTGVMSYANTVGSGIPEDFLTEDITGQFYSENYARIITYTDTEYEGDVAFALVEEINDTISKYYDEATVFSAGQSSSLYDMKNVVAKDNIKVTIIAIISIFLVLLFTFRSGTLPFILLFTIEVGIWVNLSIPYFEGVPINFLGYLVITTVQLGATVDYAILFTSYHLDNRKIMPVKESIHLSLGETFKSILMSAATLATAGFVLGATSSNDAVASLGFLLGRGTIFSFVMVVCVLPLLLRIFDKPTGALTYKAQFYKKPKKQISNSEGENINEAS